MLSQLALDPHHLGHFVWLIELSIFERTHLVAVLSLLLDQTRLGRYFFSMHAPLAFVYIYVSPKSNCKLKKDDLF